MFGRYGAYLKHRSETIDDYAKDGGFYVPQRITVKSSLTTKGLHNDGIQAQFWLTASVNYNKNKEIQLET